MDTPITKKNKEMDNKISELKVKFSDIREARDEIKRIFEILTNKIIKLNSLYDDFSKQNKNSIFVFGLDSFNFQTKLIDKEFEQMYEYYKLIANRMYCDYYKLYGLIKEYICSDTLDINKNNNLLATIEQISQKKYPKYDYIDMKKTYLFETTNSLFNDIISIIGSLHDYSKTNNMELKTYRSKIDSGLNINNFIHTFTYQNSIMSEKILLFVKYIDFFLQLHTKYYTRFITKLKIMFGQINHDIQIDDNTFNKREQTNKFLKQIEKNMDDTTVMNELKHSLESDTSNDDDSDSSVQQTQQINKPIDLNFKIHKQHTIRNLKKKSPTSLNEIEQYNLNHLLEEAQISSSSLLQEGLKQICSNELNIDYDNDTLNYEVSANDQE